MFYIRTDANKTIALGHLMRCLAIADAVKSLGEDVTFIKADEYENDRIKKAGYAVLCLNSDWRDMESELPVLKTCILDNKIPTILVDSYQVTEKYMEELHQMVQLFYMDDLAEQAYSTDVVINYALADYNKLYQKLYLNKETKCLLGSQYAPLRKAFQKINPRITQDKISDILVTTGGSDPYQILSLVATKIATDRKYQDTIFHMVLGAFVEESVATQIIQQSGQRGNIKCYRNIPNMEELMQKCDLAISAAGSTLYELCACQTPTICFAFADNQLPAIAAMKQSNVMRTVGDVRNKCVEQIEIEIVNEIDRLQSASTREAYVRQMQMVTDGKGAIRLAKELLEIKNSAEEKNDK